jgi:hypothetical protein
MSPILIVALVVLAAVAAASLIARAVASHRARVRAAREALEAIGFRACPDQKAWLEETIARIENNKGFHYVVKDPMRLGNDPATSVYHYTKVRNDSDRENPVAEDEVLFPLKRPSAAGLSLVMKPAGVGSGGPARLLAAVATAPWDAQPDDLARLELPPELKDTNILGALAPRGARLHDLVDSKTLGVVQGFGDAGALMVHFRDNWCTVSETGSRIPFQVGEIVSRVRSLTT